MLAVINQWPINHLMGTDRYWPTANPDIALKISWFLANTLPHVCFCPCLLSSPLWGCLDMLLCILAQVLLQHSWLTPQEQETLGAVEAPSHSKSSWTSLVMCRLSLAWKPLAKLSFPWPRPSKSEAWAVLVGLGQLRLGLGSGHGLWEIFWHTIVIY